MAEETLLPPLEEIMALSTRLMDHADSIVNPAAHEMETDLRKASDLLRRYVTLLAHMEDDGAARRFKAGGGVRERTERDACPRP
jgi:hypothetical protein